MTTTCSVPSDIDGTRIVCAGIVRKGLIEGQAEWIEDFPKKFVLKSSGDDPQTPAISVGIHSFSRPVLHFTIQAARGSRGCPCLCLPLQVEGTDQGVPGELV